MKRFKIGGVPEHFNLPWRLAIEEGKFRELDVELHIAMADLKLVVFQNISICHGD